MPGRIAHDSGAGDGLVHACRTRATLRALVSPPRAYLTLFAGVLFVSTAGPFLKAAALDAFAVVLWRLVASGVLFLGWATLRRELAITRRQLGLVTAGSLLLTAHFALWIKAFDLTDFSSNLLLLVAQPVIAAVVGHRLGERTSRSSWLAVGLAVVGLAIITGGDLALGPRALVGDGLSILGSFAITYFYVVTKDVRSELPLATFLGYTMGIGAVATLPIALISGAKLVGYPNASWGWVAALVVITTLAGHGCFNVAARHLRLFTVNIVIVLEPAIGIAMGAVMFGATVTPLQMAGGLVLAVAVIVGLQPQRGRPVEVEVSDLV
jgi:drug/metabolite transporter (DMT)-like permease